MFRMIVLGALFAGLSTAAHGDSVSCVLAHEKAQRSLALYLHDQSQPVLSRDVDVFTNVADAIADTIMINNNYECIGEPIMLTYCMALEHLESDGQERRQNAIAHFAGAVIPDYIERMFGAIDRLERAKIVGCVVSKAPEEGSEKKQKSRIG